MTTTIRASRLPLALACPASLVDDGGPRSGRVDPMLLAFTALAIVLAVVSMWLI